MELSAKPATNPSSRYHLAALAAVAFIRFVNLGFADLQAWDESLYAMRSLAVVRYGAFFDQTPYAVDGLYSSLHPPLFVWLTGALLAIFGQSEFIFRFWSAFFGGATLFVLYLLGKQLSNATTGFYAALLFGLNPFVSFFSRQGQFDASLTFFLALSLLLLLHAIQRQQTSYYGYTGLSVGAALMTKLFVGSGIIVTFLLWVVATRQRFDTSFRKALKMIVLGACVALPWHLFMTLTQGHGDPLFFVKQSALWERTFQGIEGNIKPTGPFYFVNQMFVLYPLGVAFFISGLLRMKTEENHGWMLLYLWFVIVFGAFTLIRTKLAVYVLPMLVPASLIAAREMDYFAREILSPLRRRIILTGTAGALVWSSSQDLRNAVKNVIVSLLGLSLPDRETLWLFFVLLSSFVGSGAIVYLLCRGRRIGVLSRRYPVIALLPAAVWLIYIVTVRDSVDYKDGGVELKEFIQRFESPSLVVAGFERNPQLTYYLDGADIGWRREIRIRRILPPHRREEYRRWLHEELFYEPPETILIVEKDKLIRYEVVDPTPYVPDGMNLVLETRRYACYQRRPAAFLANMEID